LWFPLPLQAFGFQGQAQATGPPGAGGEGRDLNPSATWSHHRSLLPVDRQGDAARPRRRQTPAPGGPLRPGASAGPTAMHPNPKEPHPAAPHLPRGSQGEAEIALHHRHQFSTSSQPSETPPAPR